MSNFLKNLVTRSAGLPVSARILPPRAVETSFRSGKVLDEVATEVTTTPLAPQSIPISSRFGTHDIQRAAANESPASPPTHIGPVSVHFPSTEGIDSSTRITPVVQVQPDSAKSRIVSSHDQNVDEGREFEAPQTIEVLRESDFGARSGEAQTPLPAKVVVDRAVSLPGIKAVATLDPVIRPAHTQQTTSFQFPRLTSAPLQTPATLPIHVRVGRIEIKGNAPQQAPARQAPGEVTPLGFAGYQRLRRYRY